MDQLTVTMITTAPFGIGALVFFIAGLIIRNKNKKA